MPPEETNTTNTEPTAEPKEGATDANQADRQPAGKARRRTRDNAKRTTRTKDNSRARKIAAGEVDSMGTTPKQAKVRKSKRRPGRPTKEEQAALEEEAQKEELEARRARVEGTGETWFMLYDNIMGMVAAVTIRRPLVWNEKEKRIVALELENAAMQWAPRLPEKYWPLINIGAVSVGAFVRSAAQPLPEASRPPEQETDGTHEGRRRKAEPEPAPKVDAKPADPRPTADEEPPAEWKKCDRCGRLNPAGAPCPCTAIQ